MTITFSILLRYCSSIHALPPMLASSSNACFNTWLDVLELVASQWLVPAVIAITALHYSSAYGDSTKTKEAKAINVRSVNQSIVEG
ncbi:hypothetical protein GOBAR_AA23373 [Gossypium barbadense]|uniref:Uncharacterized protein n=1 Tax=Gossypium barbadense TaxID=3634 RepID=A0A2P5X1V1_GOSBA|nr:hypothetical protein GOBAR_AA23373 [Gossypium barbadense]